MAAGRAMIFFGTLIGSGSPPSGKAKTVIAYVSYCGAGLL